MDGSLTIIGSVVGSIILSILGNLLTNPVKNWLDRKNLVNKSERINSLEKELKFISELSQDSQKLILELIAYNLRASFMFMIGICGGLVGVAYLVMMVPSKTLVDLAPNISSLESYPSYFPDIWFILGMGSAAFASIFIIVGMNIFNRAISIYNNAIKFDEFKKKVQDRIQELKKQKAKK